MTTINTKLRTEIICIIDKSGSMNSMKDDAIGGFNYFLNEQKQIKDDTKITLTLFDTKHTNLYTELDVEEAMELTNENFQPRFQTALYDTLAHCIHEAKERHKESMPDRTLVVILTDGQENASREWDKAGVAKLISEMEEQNWEFIYLGANQDAMVEGGKIGIKSGNTLSYNFAEMGNVSGMGSVFNAMADTVKSYRTSSLKSSKTLINKTKFKDYKQDGKEEKGA